ncbi:MAG: hypothetical protein JSV45_04520 [Chromatiales bacterium]|nr:MAG: hypothetical protein JSV45_04520 [Chromatiales bacterium]
MPTTRQLAVCCIALALLLSGLPGLTAAASDSGHAGLTSCHAEADAPAMHDDGCAMGCDSNPVPESPIPDWAPGNRRNTEDDEQSPACPAPAFGTPLAAQPVASIAIGPRAPPRLATATPVARHDILRD